MAEIEKQTATKEPEPKEAPAPPKPGSQPPLVMRALLGFAGLSLLVGFFLPWARIPPAEGSAEVHFQNGMDLVLSTDIEGTPAAIVLVIPILGALLSAIAFMGLRFAAHTAIGVAVSVIAYALYVLASMFLQNTGYGLWVVTVGTLFTLLLGIGTIMLARRAEATAVKVTEPAKK